MCCTEVVARDFYTAAEALTLLTLFVGVFPGKCFLDRTDITYLSVARTTPFQDLVNIVLDRIAAVSTLTRRDFTDVSDVMPFQKLYHIRLYV